MLKKQSSLAHTIVVLVEHRSPHTHHAAECHIIILICVVCKPTNYGAKHTARCWKRSHVSRVCFVLPLLVSNLIIESSRARHIICIQFVHCNDVDVDWNYGPISDLLYIISTQVQLKLTVWKLCQFKCDQNFTVWFALITQWQFETMKKKYACIPKYFKQDKSVAIDIKFCRFIIFVI